MYQVCAIARNVREFAGGCVAACPLFTVDELVRRLRREARLDLRGAAQQAGACGYVLKDNLFEVRRFLERSRYYLGVEYPAKIRIAVSAVPRS